jgi:hypothetical protein
MINELKSRRFFLRGAGVALALPWMESLPVFAQAQNAAAAPANRPPLRFATLYWSNGIKPAHWWAKGSGPAMEFGPSAASLQEHAQDIVFIKGLFNEQAYKNPSPHQGRNANLLSGAWVSSDPSVIRVGTSVDQVIAKDIGSRTSVPSMALGIEPNELRLEDGLSMIYASNISWETPTRPATKEIYPARVFDSLVDDGKGRKLDRSILDAVLQDTHDIQPKISSGDRRKLDEYLESVRSIEKRIDTANKQERIEGWRPTLERPNMPRPANEIPQNVPDHMKLMLDLIVLAFQMDKTRIATCMLNNDLSQMNFKFLEGCHGALHLDLTHNGHVPELEAMYLKTNQFHVKQFTYLVQRMKNIDEGGSSLFDNSILMFTSSLYDGDAHGADQLPIVLAGGAGGALKGGRILDFLDKGNDNRRACSLYLSIMDQMGVNVDRFGDADKRLPEVFA